MVDCQLCEGDEQILVELLVKYRHQKRLAYTFEVMPEVPYWHWEISSHIKASFESILTDSN